jgi:tetratricopeptide (TPR) repeat protein
MRVDAFASAAAELRDRRLLRNPRLRKLASELRGAAPGAVEQALEAYLATSPDDPDALMMLAQARRRAGQSNQAEPLLARCLALAPDFTAARFSYAELLFSLHKFEAALEQIDLLLADESGNPLFRQLKARVFEQIGENKSSLAICEELASENPGRAESWIASGHALRAIGNQDRSIAAYRKALEIRPSFGLAHASLANLKTFRFTDAEIMTMEAHLRRSEISADDRINLQFALGKAYEDIAAYSRSFEQYARANAALRLRIDYDPEKLSAQVRRTKALFTSEFLRDRSGMGCTVPDPIFIVGRPRSGSTLIEQILSSHSAVEGTAELPYLPDLARELSQAGNPPGVGTYPEILRDIDAAALGELGERFLESARSHRKLGRPFFIDKNPANHLHIGLIVLALPKAKIIDARRHPAACSFSMFKQHFSKTNLRLGELGRAWRDYAALMAHFDRVLPGRIHRVVYENVVAEPETEVRRLLRYLELPFEESCLRFHETQRVVFTPSSEQVRRPISNEAVDHWRHYEPWLKPLLEALSSTLTHYPMVPHDLL